MIRCYFLRHGIAVESDEWDGSDFDRPLSDEGRERMTREARTMARLDLGLDVVVTSPLVRAKQTAAIVAKTLGLEDRLVEDARVGLGFGPGHVAGILREHTKANVIMLVGHEPTMSHTVGHLVGGARVDFKKGSLARIDLAEPSSLKGTLAWLVSAKLLAL